MDQEHVLMAPSVLSADFTKLGEAIEMINKSKADWIHFDVMDGVFVPNISIGIPVLKSISKIKHKPLDVHLMIINPENFINEFAKAGADHITVHYEASSNLHRLINQIKDCGCKAGVAINPHIPVSHLSEIIADLDIINLMAVNPGFSGQQFIYNTYNKIERTHDLIKNKNSSAKIVVDGGVNFENAEMLIKHKADVLVAGSTVFDSNDPLLAIQKLKNL